MRTNEKKLPPIRRRVLSASEREHMQAQLDQNAGEMAGKIDGAANLSPLAKGSLYDEGDGSDLRARSARLKRAMDAGASQRLGGVEQARAEKRVKDLTEYLRSRMVPREATELRPGSVQFNRARNMMVKNELGSPQFQNAASEFKNLQRTLHPEDPDAANLENIRPETA